MQLKQIVPSIVDSNSTLWPLATRINVIALCTALLTGSAGIAFYLLTSEISILIGAMTETACFLAVPLISRRGFPHTAAITMQLTHVAGNFYFGSLFNRYLEAGVLTIFIIGTSFLLLRDARSRIICSAAILLCLISLHLNELHQFIRPLVLNGETGNILHYSLFVLILILCGGVMMLYILQNDRLFRRLQDTREKLENQTLVLEHSNAALEKANITKSIFLRETSHEIRNPLNAIYGISQLMMMEGRYDNTLVTNLHAASYNVTQTINNILELSKIEAGHADDIQEDAFLVDDWMQGIVQIYRYIAAPRSVRIRTETNIRLPDAIISDKLKLTQIVNNLLSNAIQRTVNGGTVTIRLFAAEDLLHLEAADEGSQIAAEDVSYLFDPYGKPHSNFAEGAGLDMPIAKRLIELLGGHLLWQNNTTAGCTFTAVVPLVKIDEPDIAVSAENYDLNGKTVLVVEDNIMNQVVFSNFLSSSGCKLEMAENGLVGLEKARMHKPDIILLDMHMPVMDGRTALKELKKDPLLKHIPVIAVSADCFKEAIWEVKEAGACDYMLKPVQYKPLYAVINKHMKACPAKETLTSGDV